MVKLAKLYKMSFIMVKEVYELNNKQISGRKKMCRVSPNVATNYFEPTSQTDKSGSTCRVVCTCHGHKLEKFW